MEDIISELIEQLRKAESAGLPTDEIQARLDAAHELMDEYAVSRQPTQRDYGSAYKYLRENHSIDAANRILEDAMSHEGLTRKDDYGFSITYTDGYFYTEAAS